MDSDDLEFAKDVETPTTPEDWAALAASRPCGCPCVRGIRPEPEPVPERDWHQEYKDDLAMGRIHEDLHPVARRPRRSRAVHLRRLG
jgi:hypothetical protein